MYMGDNNWCPDGRHTNIKKKITKPVNFIGVRFATLQRKILKL